MRCRSPPRSFEHSLVHRATRGRPLSGFRGARPWRRHLVAARRRHAHRQVPAGREGPRRSLRRQGVPAGETRRSARRSWTRCSTIAGVLGASADQVAIAWAGTHGAVPMIGPRSLAQLTSNLGALALGLSAEQLGRLDAVSGIGPSAPARKPVPWASDERARRAVA